MKTEEFRRKLIEEKYLRRWISKGTWSWNNDGSINVEGGIQINDKFSKLPFKFRKVSLWFQINNVGLTTLENCPEEVGGFFGCEWNKLTSLEYSPKIVKESYFIGNNIGKKFTKEDVKKVCKINYHWINV